MNENFETLSRKKAVSYVCTKTEEGQKYVDFLLEAKAKDKDIDIVENYRDFENDNNSSQRQGYARMIEDIKAGIVPAVLVIDADRSRPLQAQDLENVEVIPFNF